MIRPVRALALLLASLLFVSCTGSAGGNPGDRLRAVATYSVIYDLGRQIAGDRAEVTSLVPVGTDPHTYEPKPSDMRRLAEADLILYNGLNLELWFDRLVQGSGTRARIVVASQGIKPIFIQDPFSRYNGAPDPHAWMDVQHVMRHYVPNIRDGFITADPGGAEVYRRNAARYIAQLEELDAWLRSQVLRIPVERRQLVTTENATLYFAARYGFQVVGWVYTLAPEAEPPARRIAELTQRVRNQRVPALFIDLTLNSKLMERISQETGVPIRGALYIDTLGAPGSGADSYLGMMRANVEILVEGLRGTP
ncbi:MAG: metal ABC transporter solute-binding protein, Zn/Mn family [Candidatus Methylomirabilales bacterium]